MKVGIKVPDCAVIYCPTCNQKFHPVKAFQEAIYVTFELPCGHKVIRVCNSDQPFDCMERKCTKI
jgi:hypothetical protein